MRDVNKARRRVLKLTGGVSLMGMAGCISGGDNGGSDGQSPMSLVTGPSAYYAVIMHYAEKEGILKKHLNDAGYTVDQWTKTFNERPLLAGGKTDIAHPSVLGAARMTTETDLQLSIAGKVATNFLAMCVKQGSKYDPDKTGGVKQTIDMIAEDNAKIGIGTWGGSDVPGYSIAFNQYGYDFSQDTGDLNIRQVGYATVPKAIEKGDIQMGGTSPMHGAPEMFMQDPPKLKPVFWVANKLVNDGFGMPMQYNVACKQSFMDEHEAGVKAIVDTWDEAIEWWWDNGASAMDQDDFFDAYGWADTVEGAKYAQKWGAKKLSNRENPSFPVIYKDPHLDDDWIEMNKNYMNKVAELGLGPSNWQEDVEYVKV